MSPGFGNGIENSTKQIKKRESGESKKQIRSGLAEIKSIRTELEQKTDFLARLQTVLPKMERIYTESQSKLLNQLQTVAQTVASSQDAMYPIYTYTHEYVVMLCYSIEAIKVMLDFTENEGFVKEANYIYYFFLPLYLSNFIFTITGGVRRASPEIKMICEFVGNAELILHTLIETAKDPKCAENSELEHIVSRGRIFGELYDEVDILIFERVKGNNQDLDFEHITEDKKTDSNDTQQSNDSKSRIIKSFLADKDQKFIIDSWVKSYIKVLEILPEVCENLAQQSAVQITIRKIQELKREAQTEEVYNYILLFLSNISFLNRPVFLGDSVEVADQSWRNLDLFRQLQNVYFKEIFEIKLGEWQNEFSLGLEATLSSSDLPQLNHMKYALNQNLPIDPWLEFLGQKMNLPGVDIAPYCIYDLNGDILRSYLLEVVENKIKEQQSEQANLQLFDTSRKLADQEYRSEIFQRLNEYVQSVGLSVEQIKTLLEGVSKGHNEQFLKSHLVRLSNTLGIGLIDKGDFSQNYYVIKDVLVQGLENIYRLEQLKYSKYEQSNLSSLAKINSIFKGLNQEKYRFCIANSCSIPRELNKHWLEDLYCLVENLNKVNSMSDLLSFRAFDSNSRFSTMEFKSLTDSNNTSFSIRLKANKIKNRAEFRLEAKDGKEVIYLERLGGHD